MTIRDILDDLKITYKEYTESAHVTPGWIGIVCPMPGCGQGGKYGRGIHIKTLKTTCWKCGNARLGDVLAAASGATLSRVLPLVKSVVPSYVPDEPQRASGRYLPPDGIGPLVNAHTRYLTNRGFDPDKLSQLYGVQGIANGSKLQWRIFIPVAQPDGKPGSWTTRAVGNVEPRYISAKPSEENRPIKSLLFGERLAVNSVVVTEGVFDAMRIGPGAVSVMGVNVSAAQVARIARYPLRAIAFDSDQAGQMRAQQLADSLSVFPGQTVVVRMDAKDPATASADDIAELRAQFLE